MKQITEISQDPKQIFDIFTEDNQNFELRLEYSDQQQGWFYGITFGEFILNGARLVTGTNILRSYQNIIPFGITILTSDLSEPLFIDDFSTDRVEMLLLTQEEVEQIETDFYNK